MSKITSARGEVVDFNLLRMKEELASKPKSDTNANREKAIKIKQRRGSTRRLEEMLYNIEQKKAANAAKAQKAEATNDLPPKPQTDGGDDVEKAEKPVTKVVRRKTKKDQ